ncbi:hypothetical protein D3C71_2229190 [compost metagenome]
MSKIVVGEKPVSDWPKVITQWKQQGGDQGLAEAANAYKSKAYHPLRMKVNPIPVVKD